MNAVPGVVAFGATRTTAGFELSIRIVTPPCWVPPSLAV